MCLAEHVSYIVRYLWACTLAISDAVRTSLGPRGMDKMVRVLFDVLAAIIDFNIDSDIQGRGHRNQ